VFVVAPLKVHPIEPPPMLSPFAWLYQSQLFDPKLQAAMVKVTVFPGATSMQLVTEPPSDGLQA